MTGLFVIENVGSEKHSAIEAMGAVATARRGTALTPLRQRPKTLAHIFIAHQSEQQTRLTDSQMSPAKKKGVDTGYDSEVIRRDGPRETRIDVYLMPANIESLPMKCSSAAPLIPNPGSWSGDPLSYSFVFAAPAFAVAVVIVSINGLAASGV